MTDGENESDEALAAQAGRGDRLAFEHLVRRHKAPLYRFIRPYAGQRDDAYDILQETFVAAWSAAARYDPSRPFLPWLRTIALNKCRDFGRRQAIRRLLLRAKAVEPPDLPRAWNDESETETDRLNRLDRAIAALPPFYKEPLLLTAISGLSHHEAAQILHTTAKAIEMRIYRAKRKLAVDLGEPPEG